MAGLEKVFLTRGMNHQRKQEWAVDIYAYRGPPRRRLRNIRGLTSLSGVGAAFAWRREAQTLVMLDAILRRLWSRTQALFLLILTTPFFEIVLATHLRLFYAGVIVGRDYWLPITYLAREQQKTGWFNRFEEIWRSGAIGAQSYCDATKNTRSQT